jgi:hypothetical protein
MQRIKKFFSWLDDWAWSIIEPIMAGESKAPASVSDDAKKHKPK